MHGDACGGSDREAAEHLVGQLLALVDNEDAARLLGLEGALADQVDVAFLEDPFDYVSYDIATAIIDARSDRQDLTTTPMLSTLVAELKLCRLLEKRTDLHDLSQRVVEHIRAQET